MNRFHLSQSCLKDFEEMCPLAFSVRWFGTEEQRNLFQRDSDAMKRGVLFETLAIGMGLNGKTSQPGDVDPNSVVYKRIQKHAAMYRKWEAEKFPKILGTQMSIQVRVEWDGGVYYAQGNLDRVARDRSSMVNVIDLKLRDKLDSDYGKFQFANPRKIDWTQLKHYRILAKTKFNEEVNQMYYVADSSKEDYVKPISPVISPWHEYEHHRRCQAAYDAITMNLTLDDWTPKPSFSKCSTCPLGMESNKHALERAGLELCKHRVKVPDIEVYELE